MSSASPDPAALALPEPVTPGGNYVPTVRSGRQLLIAGQIPRLGEQVQLTGVIGDGLTIQDGQRAAALCARNALAAALRAEGVELRNLRLLSLNGFMRCTPEFGQQALVMDGASDVFIDALGERGRHVRTAVGVYALPRHVPVEISVTFEILDDA